MVYELNLLGTILTASNGIILACMLWSLARTKGVAHKPYLLLACVYTSLQGIAGGFVASDLYFHNFSIRTAVIRVSAALAGQAITVIMAVHYLPIKAALRAQFNADMKLADDRSDRLMAAEALTVAATTTSKNSDGHIQLLGKQGSRMAQRV